mmetsp:Transcript_70278/g.124552  ORF Transcript_70278/g.124552 Transcript_70278/m.124552 type:complete len:81 (-) Transcript_70278:22-264(-)
MHHQATWRCHQRPKFYVRRCTPVSRYARPQVFAAAIVMAIVFTYGMEMPPLQLKLLSIGFIAKKHAAAFHTRSCVPGSGC